MDPSGLLGESLSLFARLYHTYPSALSCKSALPLLSPLTLSLTTRGLHTTMESLTRAITRTSSTVRDQPSIPGSSPRADMLISLPSRFVESTAPRSTTSGALSVPKFERPHRVLEKMISAVGVNEISCGQ